MRALNRHSTADSIHSLVRGARLRAGAGRPLLAILAGELPIELRADLVRHKLDGTDAASRRIDK